MPHDKPYLTLLVVRCGCGAPHFGPLICKNGVRDRLRLSCPGYDFRYATFAVCLRAVLSHACFRRRRI